MAYAFGPARIYTLEEARGLDSIHRSQICQGTQNQLGEDCDDVDACAHAIAKLEDIDWAEVVFTCYPIMLDGTLTFEMWTFGGGDDGTVFHANSDEPTWVHAVQGSFQALVDDAEVAALAKELGRVAPL